MQRPVLVDDILGLIGNTPLVRLRKVAGSPETHATVWGKCEMLNPGGSVKDRIALAMIEAAEATGQITPGKSVLVEPTSGNTGIGLALVAAVKGYRLILTMPESMSLERRNLLKAYGAEIVLTPEDQTMEGAVNRAIELCRRPDHHMLQQFENPANPEIHRRSTAPEIIEQMGARTIDGFVSPVGT
ncbi:MAG: cysteine synthase family protein, partial [Myxococcales bacterium]|nr:cysteine synthase family protein [Myxococcales bacterium]